MSELAYLATKCAFAALVMIAIHYISKSHSYFLSALALSFPGLSTVAYYFMFYERGAHSVATTTRFAIFATIPFLSFLFTLNAMVKTHGILAAVSIAMSVWLALSVVVVAAWLRWH